MLSFLARFNSTVVTFIGFFFLFSLLIVSNISEALAQVNEPRGGPRVYKYETPEVWRESLLIYLLFLRKVVSVNIKQEVKQDLIFILTCLQLN
jgi:hypothetical protein